MHQMLQLLLLLMLLLLQLNQSANSLVTNRYTPDWKSIDSRPLPAWYDKAKVGIFIHWGVFSVPAFGSEWFWWRWKGVPPFVPPRPEFVQFMQDNYPKNFAYADFARSFKAELFDAKRWAELIERSGARYVVLTTKHHEGYCMWNSTHSSMAWNAGDVGPKRDLVGELATAVRQHAKDVHFGVYHSLYEWYNPLYLSDAKSLFVQRDFVRYKTMPELYELVQKYKPDVIWSDGDAGSPEYWNSTQFLAWLYNDSPVRESVVVNDRWGFGTNCKHGGYLTCRDGYNPGHLVPYKFENAMSLQSGSWGYIRSAKLNTILSIDALINQLVATVSCGGNILINISPTDYGWVPAIMEERLLQLGSWLLGNGEAVYGSKPWAVAQRDANSSDVWYTASSDGSNNASVFAFVLNYPSDATVRLGSVCVPDKGKLGASVLNCTAEVGVQFTAGVCGAVLQLPALSDCLHLQQAWVLRLTGL